MEPSAFERLTDAELVALLRAGVKECYAALVQRHQAPLYRHALGMVGSADAAADLVQDALVRAYTRLESCRDPERFGAWVFQILRNRCLDYLKDRRRNTVPLTEEMACVGESDDPEARLEQAELRREVLRALETLSAPMREAFLLKHVEGRSYEEMSEMLGASESALKMRVMRAREALQSRLSAVHRV
jgi:RNA polymerase sigma-70 factor (ECF subfamily)